MDDTSHSPYGARTATAAPNALVAPAADGAWTMVRLGAGLVGLAGLLGTGLAVALIIWDQSDRTDSWDGFAMLIGFGVGAVALVLLAIAGGSWWLGRRSPVAGGSVLAVFGCLATGLGVVGATAFGSGLSAIVLLTGLLIGGLGFGAAAGGRSGR